MDFCFFNAFDESAAYAKTRVIPIGNATLLTAVTLWQQAQPSESPGLSSIDVQSVCIR